MSVTYPTGLPLGLHSGRSYQVVNPLQRTELSSGRARQRRRFTSTPTMASVNWYFSDVEARLFEVWWRADLVDGSLWFECPLKTPLGVSEHLCRFTGVYRGPDLVGPDIWAYSAELELLERPVLPNDWALLPSFILNPEIFDYAMNREWPLYDQGSVVQMQLEDGTPMQLEDGTPFVLENS